MDKLNRKRRFALFKINLNNIMKKINTLLLALLMGAPLLFTSCGGDDDKKDDPEPKKPTYEFYDAEGNSTVDYSGQTIRIEKFKTLMDELKKGNTGETVSLATLKAMFADEGYTWSDSDLNAASGKKLKDKTLNAGAIETLFEKLATASESTTEASVGVAGVLGGKRLVDENGIEYQQVIEKAMYGALFFNQIANNYLTVDKIELAPNTPAEGKNYSPREHHWDEAFGYFGAPVDFPQEGVKNGGAVYIAKYVLEMDEIGTNVSKELMNAFINGRAAITNNDTEALAAAKAVIYEQIELTFAKAAIHYLNRTNSQLADVDAVNRLHALSEGWGFMLCLPVSIQAKTSTTELITWQAEIGTNFWEVQSDDLISVRDQIASKYGISPSDRNAL